jgi:hypothetical protein
MDPEGFLAAMAITHQHGVPPHAAQNAVCGRRDAVRLSGGQRL